MNSLLNVRYEADCERISRELFQGNDPGRISSVSITGDRHLHGEAVTEVHTSEGLKLFYKPRDCQNTDLCGDLTQLLFGERMVPVQVAGKGYAFQKSVERQLPDTEIKKKAYYENLGRLTALFYALGSTDMHNGNILCNDTCPVVIDTETLLNARAEGFAGNGEFSLDYGEVFPDYRTNVGESMVLPRFYGFMQTTPLIPGENCHPEGYDKIFISGFQNGYRKICENTQEIIRILENYKDAPLRVVLRSTQYYSVKIQMYHSARTTSDREHVLKGLEKGLNEADLSRWEQVLGWERECICEGDVPYFCFLAGGRDLYGALDLPVLIRGYMEHSPIEYAAWRMGQMCEQDLQVQTAYIRASLNHLDGWERTDSEKEVLQKPETGEAVGTGAEKEQEVLSVQEAVEETAETLRKLWEERIALSDGCCLWHAPMINGKIGSLFGVEEGFSGVAVFVHACVQSTLITGEPAQIAKDLHKACFQNLAAFGEYLLKTYHQPPEERTISRRFNGGFGFADGISGFLWALKLLRQEDPSRTDCILKGFQSWPVKDEGEEHPAILNHFREGKVNDCLEQGNAARAASLLFDRERNRNQEAAVYEAGILLKQIVSRKKRCGCYQVFQKGRRCYFLPAFLQGTTGIAYVLLSYANMRAKLVNCKKQMEGKK